MFLSSSHDFYFSINWNEKLSMLNIQETQLQHFQNLLILLDLWDANKKYPTYEVSNSKWSLLNMGVH